MDENKVEVIETTEEMGTEDGMEKRFDLNDTLGILVIGAGSIAVFEGGKWVVKKLKEPVKKGCNWIKGKFRKEKEVIVIDSSEPNHEELIPEVKEKAKAKKSDKPEK